MRKKAQMTMEYLIIVAVIIAVALAGSIILVKMGVFDLSKFQPNACVLASGVGCTSYQVKAAATGSVTIKALNGLGEDISAVTLTLLGDGTACANTASGPQAIGDGSEATFVFDCTAAPSGSRFKSDVKIAYTQAGIAHILIGSINAPVESAT